MKNNLKNTLLILGLLIAVSLTSCKQDPCDLINCAYSGACEPSTKSCICQIGYEGDNCAIVSRDKFISDGTYSVEETGTFTPYSNYTSIIEAGTVINEVKITNLRNGILNGGNVLGTVSNDSLFIPAQVVNGYEIEGLGIIEGRNPVSGSSFYDQAIIRITYKTTNLTNNTVDAYGTGGADVSVWYKN